MRLFAVETRSYENAPPIPGDMMTTKTNSGVAMRNINMQKAASL